MAFARSQETELPTEFSAFQEKQFGRLLGPVPRERGGTNAVVIRHGFIVAEFDPFVKQLLAAMSGT